MLLVALALAGWLSGARAAGAPRLVRPAPVQIIRIDRRGFDWTAAGIGAAAGAGAVIFIIGARLLLVERQHAPAMSGSAPSHEPTRQSHPSKEVAP